jgi:DNA-binding NarL/FixJ family response regulator
MKANPVLSGGTPTAASGQACFSVLVISTVRLLRDAVGASIRCNQAFSISGFSGNPMETLAMALDRQPDIALLDAAFPGGIDIVGRIRHVAPRTLIIVLFVPETNETIIAWAGAGVAGYIPDTVGPADLAPFLAAIIRGERPSSERTTAGLLRRVAGAKRSDSVQVQASLLPVLTARERQIVQLIDAGFSNKEIARRLNIEVATTKSHVHNLLGKLALQRRGQVALWMRLHGHEYSCNPAQMINAVHH